MKKSINLFRNQFLRISKLSQSRAVYNFLTDQIAKLVEYLSAFGAVGLSSNPAREAKGIFFKNINLNYV